MANNTITAPKGFLATGVQCGIKKSGKPDLGMIVCPTGAKAAAVFTTNKITSAAVQICKKHIKSANVSAVIVNSGNANTCTGQQGIKNAIKMCSETARVLQIANRKSTIVNRSILVASTGVIGEQLPIKKIMAGIAKAVAKLSTAEAAGLDFAKAIMTTDSKTKQTIRRLTIDDWRLAIENDHRGIGNRKSEIENPVVTIAGAVKGAGMIAPNMATTLCFITTDAAISKPLLAKALKTAIDNSLNKLTVDGHQSTNDTAIILASGLAGSPKALTAENAESAEKKGDIIQKISAYSAVSAVKMRLIVSQCPRYKKFAKALTELCEDLAKQMALDAEGATRMFKVVVKGAATKADAAKAARAIAGYPLVKCAVHGSDPNWGRIICAVGSAGVKLNPDKLSCKLGDITVFRNGSPEKFDAKRAGKIISQTEHTITVDLGTGKASDFCYGCDLSTEYVKINAHYHT